MLKTQSGDTFLEYKGGHCWLMSQKIFLVNSRMKSYTIFKLELFYKRIKPLSCWLSAKLGHATEVDYILEKGKNSATVFSFPAMY